MTMPLVQQLTGAVFEGLHIAVAGRGETYQGRIDPCLDDAIKTRQIAHRGKKWPPAPQCPEGHPRAIEGGRDRRTCFNYSFTGGQPILPRKAAALPEQAKRTSESDTRPAS
jgi:hypothetical protein